MSIHLKVSITGLIILFLVTACGAGETEVPRAQENYLGQIPPGEEVEVFAPGIVSIEEGKEYNITISPNLQEILFTRRTPGGEDVRIWYSHLVNGQLILPTMAPFAYDSFETDACFTPDGGRVYFNSTRPSPGKGLNSRLPGVWFVERTTDGWGTPQFLDTSLNDYQPVYFSFASDGTLYFTRSSPREIWYAEPNNEQYSDASRLPDEINDLLNIAHPAIAPDESYIIVDSVSGVGGQIKGGLYISFMNPDGSWTKIVSMQEVLKASETDIYAIPRITPDGKYLFFEKYLPAADQSDIYWVSTKIVEELKATMLKTQQ